MDKTTKPDDRTLIANTLKGDKNSFKELVKKYENQVASTVIGMLGHGQESEDIGQDTFIRFYKSLDKFRGESAVGTYLTRIAINLCINEIRKRQRWRKLFFSHPEDRMTDLPDPNNPASQNEAAKILNWGLQRLEPKYRAVIFLRLVEGYSTRETAKILKLPLGTILSQLSRGQQKLKDILTPVYRGREPILGENHG